MPILHNIQESGNCYKVRLTAHQLEIPLTIKEYQQNTNATRTPEFLSMNPNGHVPTLELDDGRAIAESNAIIWYLSEGTHLQPENKWERGQALQWMFFEQYYHEPNVAVLRRLLNDAPKEELEAKRDRLPELKKRGNTALDVMETHLSTHDWFGAEKYSVGDIALYAYTHCADEAGFNFSERPKVKAWLARVAAQPRHITLF